MDRTRTGRRHGSITRTVRLSVLSTTAAAMVLLGVAGYQVANAETLAVAACIDTTAEATAEEARLEDPVGGGSTPVGLTIAEQGGLTGIANDFGTALCDVPDLATANATVDQFGQSLWQAAVARAQGSASAGALPADDDRPLYWTRLAMARQLRQWTPGFAADQADRDGWQSRFEAASRGLTSSDFSGGNRRLFISGFDPFQLDLEIRRGNPSGAAALRLDGRVLSVGGTTVQVQAVLLPVRFGDFDAGILEAAFSPHVAAGAQGADLFTTISQGRPGQFDLEAFNGRRRSADAPDNLGVDGGGSFDEPLVFPGVGAGPEFLPSTLPLESMQAAGGTFPVLINTEVVEIQPEIGSPTRSADGPTAGSIAVEGGGGGYLSNESAYRATRLASGAGRTLPAGHLHTPILDFDPDNSTEITDPTLEANRTTIITEVEQILRAGVAAL